MKLVNWLSGDFPFPFHTHEVEVAVVAALVRRLAVIAVMLLVLKDASGGDSGNRPKILRLRSPHSFRYRHL